MIYNTTIVNDRQPTTNIRDDTSNKQRGKEERKRHAYRNSVGIKSNTTSFLFSLSLFLYNS
jgi:hypothetical protein